MESDGFHQANTMRSTLDNIRNEVFAEVRQVQYNAISAVIQSPQNDEVPFLSQTQIANVVLSNQDTTGLITVVSNLETSVSTLECVVNTSGYDDRGNLTED